MKKMNYNGLNAKDQLRIYRNSGNMIISENMVIESLSRGKDGFKAYFVETLSC